MENRERILQCALDLFYARGYDAVGVQEIADRAGITKPTLYYYFGNKIGLLKELLETEYAEIKKANCETAKYNGDIPQTLYQLTSAYIDNALSHRKMYMLMMALFYSAKENEAYQAVKPLIMDFYYTVVGIFERAAKELGNMRGRQVTFAIGFIGIINHYILLLCDKEADSITVSEQEKKELVHQFMYGIYS